MMNRVYKTLFSHRRGFFQASTPLYISKPFILADIGEGIAEVELLKWYVRKGDKVNSFDKICEVQSDKATVEITSRFEGEVLTLYHKEGNIVKVGDTLIDIDVIEAKTAESNIAPGPKSPELTLVQNISNNSQSHKIHRPFVLTDIGEGIAEVELMQWFVKEGDKIKSFDKICEVQSDKATVEITSRYNGIVKKIYYQIGSIVKVGSTLIDVEEESTEPKLNQVTSTEVDHESEVIQSSKCVNNNFEKVLTTPSVRRLAKENAIDLSLVKSTGPKGRILKTDVLDYINNKSNTSKPLVSISNDKNPLPEVPSPMTSNDRILPIRGVQRLMVKSMTAANQVPHLTLCDEIIVNKLIEVRKIINEDLIKSHGKHPGKPMRMSYMPFLIKATSLSLLEYPMLNATVNSDVTALTYHSNHNIGVAMDTTKGLIVPVIKQVQHKSLFEIAMELVFLQDAASKGTLTESQLSGGTFSLSNIGSIAGTYATPVLVVPQVAIGAIGRFQTFPRYVDKISGSESSLEDIYSGNAIVSPRSVMNISWSADHRVVDGATVAKFSNSWKSFLENPYTMLTKLH